MSYEGFLFLIIRQIIRFFSDMVHFVLFGL